jgi:Zn-dependent metalloprotease
MYLLKITCGKTQLYELELKEDTNDPNATYAPKPKLIIDCGGFLVYDLRVNTFDTTLQYRINAKTGLIINKFSPILKCGHAHGEGENCQISKHKTNTGNKEEFIVGTTLGNTLFSGTQPITTKFSYGKHRLIGGDSSTPIETRDNQLDPSLGAWKRKVTQNSLTNNTWPVSDLLHTQTHWAIEKSFNYFQDVHGKTVGANNGTLKIKSNSGVDFAAYLGDHRSLIFGFRSGFYLGILDAAGHEFTHLMIDDQTDLGSTNQSLEQDALNESFADIFGTMVERKYRPNGWDWIFEDEAVPLRDVQNPSNTLATGQQAVVYMGTGWDTNGSPHRNGGVQNRWFSLLSLGGTQNGVTVQGIGIDRSEQITMHNIENYIEKSSQYIDSRNGAVNSARDLYGECSFEHVQTQLAWQACGRGIAQNCFTSTGSYLICSDKKNLPISQTVINSFGQNLTWTPVTLNIFGQPRTTSNWTYSVSGTNNSTLTITNIPTNIALGGFYYFKYTDQSGNFGYIGFTLVECQGIGPNPPKNTDCASLSNYFLGPRTKNNHPNKNPDLVVSPNPTNGKIIVQTVIKNGNFRIIDLTGKLFIEGQYSNHELDVSSLRSGMYIIEIFDQRNKENGKFVKN